MSEKTKTIRITEELHKQLSVESAERGQSLREMAENGILGQIKESRYFRKQQKPAKGATK